MNDEYEMTRTAALGYAKRGWAVFPCDGKAPLTPHGFKDAVTDPEAVLSLFSKHPIANVGIATGKVSGFFPLDVDVRDEKQGRESLAELERIHGALPHTIESVTWSGGRHILFRYPAHDDVPCRTAFLPGLDVKSDGGYIIAPPSVIEGRSYAWEVDHHPDTTQLAEAPAWLLDLITRPATGNKNAPGWIAEALKNLHDGNRDETFCKIVGRMHYDRWMPEDIFQILSPHADKCGYPLDELEKKSRKIPEQYPTTAPTDQRVAANALPSPESKEVLDPNHPIWKTTSHYTGWQILCLALGKKGDPVSNADNVLRILERLPVFENFVWYDEFHKRYFTRYKSDSIREWSDIDDLVLTTFLQRKIGLRHISDKIVSNAIKIYAHKNIKNEPKGWLESLGWDGTERTSHFLEDYLGADKNEYTRGASKNFWTGMIARIYKPGCQLDNMVVLEGPQGIGKTRALRAIGGRWYTEANESVTSKDFFMILHGKLIIEIAELDSFSRAETTRIKQVVTCTTDRYRSPYDRRAQDHPRMCVFVGTTNEDSYLRDNTGGRRFWPIRCGDIRIDLIEANRDQLFAEAVVCFKSGATWYEMPDADTKREQEARRQGDEWESVISTFLTGRADVTVSEIATDCLKIDIGKLEKGTQMRIANVLRSVGWHRKDGWLDGKKAKFWVKNENQ